MNPAGRVLSGCYIEGSDAAAYGDSGVQYATDMKLIIVIWRNRIL